jgi:hypothetical protein
MKKIENYENRIIDKNPIIIYKFQDPESHQLPCFTARGKPTFRDLRKFADTVGYTGIKYRITKSKFYESLKLFISGKNISTKVIVPETTLITIYKDTQIYLDNIAREREINHQKLMNRLKHKKYCSI